MMRVSLKLLVACIAATVFLLSSLSYWSQCPLQGQDRAAPDSPPSRVERWRHLQASLLMQDPSSLPEVSCKNPWTPIDCLINGEYTVPCRRALQGTSSTPEVFVPFTFLHQYFEVYGKLSPAPTGSKSGDRFEWQHSYSRFYQPKGKYEPTESFFWFENYNVEVRDRVKCISATDGVPISTQWNSAGHVYPIQVAQFGLSHFSKNRSEPPPRTNTLDDGYRSIGCKWSADDGHSFSRQIDGRVRFATNGLPSDGGGVSLLLDTTSTDLVLSLDVLFTSNASSLTVTLKSEPNLNGRPGPEYRIHYATTDDLIECPEGSTQVVYGIGRSSVHHWRQLTRDLRIDLQKGLSLSHNSKKKPSVKVRNLRVKGLLFRGTGYVTNVTLASSSHLAHFQAASDWLVSKQDAKGGWPIAVTRRLSAGMMELQPGWYSAMAQGQAMSLLTRAFAVTGDLFYLESALRATALFRVRSENGGVLATFMGKYVWYEEYPTVPSSFVLNGFMYALIGLYDLKSVCSSATEDCKEANRLYTEGMISLKKLLPLYDTGSGSVYDLRHFSLGVAPNLARWDYHTTHINQLLLLSTLDDDPILLDTATRWIGYMKGKRAPHN